MDIKIKSSRLKNLLSYDWVKIVLSIVAGVVVWSLLFTTLGTRATVGEQFVFNVYGNVYTRESTKNNDILNDLKAKGYFSYDVLSLSAETVSGAGQYSWMEAYYGQEVTMEIAPCNWNDKGFWAGCVLAIRLEDGTKIMNTYNFDKF